MFARRAPFAGNMVGRALPKAPVLRASYLHRLLRVDIGDFAVVIVAAQALDVL
jgi:molybdopterin synthase catalytic subunit